MSYSINTTLLTSSDPSISAGVVVAEINEGIWPLRLDEYNDMYAISQKASNDSERSLLYVAISRAMNHAMITGTGSQPKELGQEK